MEPVATTQEVLEVLSAYLRGEIEGSRERLRAAELLGKRYGLFDSSPDGGDVSVTIEGGGALE